MSPQTTTRHRNPDSGRSRRRPRPERRGSETIEFAMLAGVLIVFFLTLFSFELIGMFRTMMVMSAWRIERVRSIYPDALDASTPVTDAHGKPVPIEVSKVHFGEYVRDRVEDTFAVSLSWPDDHTKHNYTINYRREGLQGKGFATNVLNKLTGIEQETLHWQEPGQPTKVEEHGE
ncbi:MAG: hypothetical protein NTV26_07170 [Caldiserica bacterium]|nr:hypothetical protein [Caldisericota bacterium]